MSEAMIRMFLIVVAAGLILLGIAGVFLGSFPPNPTQHSVEKVLPNEKFPSR